MTEANPGEGRPPREATMKVQAGDDVGPSWKGGQELSEMSKEERAALVYSLGVCSHRQKHNGWKGDINELGRK